MNFRFYIDYTDDCTQMEKISSHLYNRSGGDVTMDIVTSRYIQTYPTDITLLYGNDEPGSPYMDHTPICIPLGPHTRRV